MMWCMRRTNIYLDEEQTASLDRLAEQEGISRAELIRRLIDRALTGDDASRAADVAAIEESFGTVGDLESALREAGDREEHLARIWRREQ
jgi:metal-responsive CopG/Arc/MetJ family transcriptional regulator